MSIVNGIGCHHEWEETRIRSLHLGEGGGVQFSPWAIYHSNTSGSHNTSVFARETFFTNRRQDNARKSLGDGQLSNVAKTSQFFSRTLLRITLSKVLSCTDSVTALCDGKVVSVCDDPYPHSQVDVGSTTSRRFFVTAASSIFLLCVTININTNTYSYFEHNPLPTDWREYNLWLSLIASAALILLSFPTSRPRVSAYCKSILIFRFLHVYLAWSFEN